ncbi:MAG: sugar phosphate nucleotidyltransferase, partial [Calditrichota bacterium]
LFGADIGGRGQEVFMGSMGIYIIRYEALEKLLDPSMGEDFGHHVIPQAIPKFRVYAFPFTGYWEDIGTISSFYEANLALTDDQPKFELFDPEMKLFTRARFLPGARLGNALIRRCHICAGAKSSDFTAEHSIIGARAVIKSGVTIQDSYISGSDFYETPTALDENRELNRPDMGIGGDTTIRRAIIDKNARIGYGVTIAPPPHCADLDGPGYAVRDGIVIVEKNAVIPDGSVIPELK